MADIEKDALRKGDSVKVFFNGPGFFSYILVRDENIFYFCYLIGRGISVRYWPYESEHEITAVRTVLATLGIQEFPIYKIYHGNDTFRQIPGGQELLDNVAMYHADLKERKKQAEKDAKEAAKKKKKEEKLSNKHPNLNIVDTDNTQDVAPSIDSQNVSDQDKEPVKSP